MPRNFRSFLITFLISVAVFLAGIYIGGHYYRLSPLFGLLPDSVRSTFFPGDDILQLEREVEGIIEENYYQPVDRQVLENGALEGMIAALGDPYSAYFSPDDYRMFMHHTNGTFVGIGVLLEAKDGALMVVSPIDGSPAQEAGVKAGDVIIAVDGVSIEGMTDEEATALIRGEEGTPVVIRVRRGGGEELEFSIVRKNIELPVVTERVLEFEGRKIGYVGLEQFSEEAGVKVQAALEMLAAEGVEGLILDLRNNGGGLLDESVEVASVFIENGTIVSIVGRNGEKKEYEARGDANEKIELVVLVNGLSASASEIVAGAIKDDNRGILVGEKTFGKGVVQNIDELSNGGAIKYTSATYYTPDGTSINEIGIEPDVFVVDDPNTPTDEQLDRALAIFTG